VVTFALLSSALALAYLGFAALNVEIVLAKRDGRPVNWPFFGTLSGLLFLATLDAILAVAVNLR